MYHRARQLLQPSIDHVRHYLRTCRIAETIIPSDHGSDDMNESDVEQVWVAGTAQPSKDAKSNDVQRVTMPSITPPMPWDWWLRSTVIRHLLSLRRYHSNVKRFLHSVMTLRRQSLQNVVQRDRQQRVIHTRRIHHRRY